MKSQALLLYHAIYIGFHDGSVVNNPPVNAVDVGLILELGKSSVEGNSNPFQYSNLENPMERGVWWTAVHLVTKELDKTLGLNNNIYTYTHIYVCIYIWR